MPKNTTKSHKNAGCSSEMQKCPGENIQIAQLPQWASKYTSTDKISETILSSNKWKKHIIIDHFCEAPVMHYMLSSLCNK